MLPLGATAGYYDDPENLDAELDLLVDAAWLEMPVLPSAPADPRGDGAGGGAAGTGKAPPTYWYNQVGGYGRLCGGLGRGDWARRRPRTGTTSTCCGRVGITSWGTWAGGQPDHVCTGSKDTFPEQLPTTGVHACWLDGTTATVFEGIPAADANWEAEASRASKERTSTPSHTQSAPRTV